jgi:hypothetical protein
MTYSIPPMFHIHSITYRMDNGLIKTVHTIHCMHTDSSSLNIHTYIPWIHNCVIKTVRCRKSHKYTITQIYSVRYYKHFTKYYKSYLHIKKFIYRVKGVCLLGIFLGLLQILPCHS